MNIARQHVNVNIIELGKEKEPNNNGKLLEILLGILE